MWENFKYCDKSPSGLVWACDRRSGKDLRIVHAREGDIAGYLNNQGYWQVYDLVSEKSVSCHRIVIEINSQTKIPEGMQVDHIDGNRSNNSLTNLRIVDAKKNARNTKLTNRSKTKVQGVYWQQTGNVTFAVASWTDTTGKRFRKYFSTLRKGVMESFKQAVQHRNTMIELLNAQGAGYSQRHGKELS